MSNAQGQTIHDVKPPISLILIWIIGGLLGLYASFSLIMERIHVAEFADAVASCDLNPILSCKSVMLSTQAKLFGFPNPIIGLASFFAPILVAAAVLAGAKFVTWFWHIFMTGLTGGFVFVIWLMSQTLYSINALCLYCMVAWFGMIPMFWSTLIWLLKEDIIQAPIRFTNFIDSSFKWSWIYSVATELVIVVLILTHFADRLSILFSFAR